MTDKQIKSNAHKAARKLNHGEPDIYRKGYEDGYIAGAQSMLSKIEELEKHIKELEKGE